MNIHPVGCVFDDGWITLAHVVVPRLSVRLLPITDNDPKFRTKYIRKFRPVPVPPTRDALLVVVIV